VAAGAVAPIYGYCMAVPGFNRCCSISPCFLLCCVSCALCAGVQVMERSNNPHYLCRMTVLLSFSLFSFCALCPVPSVLCHVSCALCAGVQVMEHSNNPHYLYRMTVLQAISLLSPVLGPEATCSTMLPVVVAATKDRCVAIEGLGVLTFEVLYLEV